MTQFNVSKTRRKVAVGPGGRQGAPPDVGAPPRDATRTKARILAVAAEEFSGKGFAGARVDEIVRRSKISKNLIYYHFGSKEALFIAVLESAYARLREQQADPALTEMPPIEAIGKLVKDLFNYWRDSKAFIGFLTSENFYEARHLKKSMFARNAYAGLIASLQKVLEAGEKEGLFRAGVDPVDLYISISGLSYQYFANQFTLSVVLGKDFTSEESLNARLKHIGEVILGYLQFQA